MPNGNKPDRTPPEKARALELGVYLFLILPSTVLSVLIVNPASLDFSIVAISTILNDLAFVSLILFFLWRNGESLGSIGLTHRNAGMEIALGAALFFPLLLLVSVLEKAMKAAGLAVPESAPSFLVPAGTAQYALSFLLLIVIAVSEEVMFRGYLIHRLQSLTGNGTAAVLLAGLIFSLGHAYQRSGGVIGVGLLGILFGFIFLWRGSLLAPMTMHLLQNFVGIILMPLSKDF